MRRILYINYMNDLFGSSIGSTIKAMKLLGGLERLGWKVTFAWRRDGWKEPSRETKPRPALLLLLRRFLFTPKEILFNLIDFFKEYRLAQRTKPILLIVRLDAFRISSLAVARLFKIPLIVEADGACSYEWIYYHGGPHIWKRPLLLCERLMLRFADGVFTQSNVARSYYEQVHGSWKTDIIVIPNGADPIDLVPEKTESLRRELGLTSQDLIVGFLGSMHKWHGLGEVRDLMVELLKELPQVKLMFVGGGGAQQDLIDSFPSAQKEKVIFIRTVPYALVSHYISIFSIAVAPYPPTPLFYFSPVKIFDYMAAGKAILAPRLGQISEILQHGVNALLYEPGNTAEFYRLLLMLCRDEQLCERLGNEAKSTFLKAHTWNERSNVLHHFLLRQKDLVRRSA